MPTSRTAAELGAATTSAAVAAIAAMTLRTLAPYNGSLVLSRQSPDELDRRLRGARDPELRRRRRGADPRREPAARAEPGRDEPPGVRAARRRTAAPRPPRRLLAAGHLLRSRRDRRALPRDGGADRRGRSRDRAPRRDPPLAAPPRRGRGASRPPAWTRGARAGGRAARRLPHAELGAERADLRPSRRAPAPVRLDPHGRRPALRARDRARDARRAASALEPRRLEPVHVPPRAAQRERDDPAALARRRAPARGARRHAPARLPLRPDDAPVPVRPAGPGGGAADTRRARPRRGRRRVRELRGGGTTSARGHVAAAPGAAPLLRPVADEAAFGVDHLVGDPARLVGAKPTGEGPRLLGSSPAAERHGAGRPAVPEHGSAELLEPVRNRIPDSARRLTPVARTPRPVSGRRAVRRRASPTTRCRRGRCSACPGSRTTPRRAPRPGRCRPCPACP